jgi:hypothetical protein
MEIKRVSSQPSGRGRQSGSLAPCGSIRFFRHPIRHGFRTPASRFEPGARTAWHTHPLGQTLVLTAGCGQAQRWGGPSDMVWFAPGEKHWHGAAPTTAMTHIAIQEKLDGKVVDWMEQVAGEQYRAGK